MVRDIKWNYRKVTCIAVSGEDIVKVDVVGDI